RNMPRRAVHDNAGRLVDHREPFVLVHDVQRRGRGAHRLRPAGAHSGGIRDDDDIVVVDAPAGTSAPAVDADQPRVDHRARRVSRQIAVSGEPHIKARLGHEGAGAARGRNVNTTPMTPSTMAESARLNTGHQCRSMKSTTWPCSRRSTPLDSAPPRISPSTTWRNQPVPNR